MADIPSVEPRNLGRSLHKQTNDHDHQNSLIKEIQNYSKTPYVEILGSATPCKKTSFRNTLLESPPLANMMTPKPTSLA